MADRPDDQNIFSIRGLEEPYRRYKEVVHLHPPGSEKLGFTEVNPRDNWFNRWMESIALAQEMESPLAVILANNQVQMNRVKKAATLAVKQAAGLIAQETGAAAVGLFLGLIPMIRDLALWAGAGAALGATAAGVFLGPEAAPAGAVGGFNLGLWAGGIWGIKDILAGMVTNLDKFIELSSDGVEIAWYAGTDRGSSEVSDLADAAEFFAFAYAELWMVLLSAIVAYLMKKAMKAIPLHAPEGLKIDPIDVREVAERLKASKLPKGFGEWFEKNFDQIQKAINQWTSARASEKSDQGKAEEEAKAAEEAKAKARDAAKAKREQQKADIREREREKALQDAIKEADANGALDKLSPEDRAWLESDSRNKELAVDPDGDLSYKVDEAKAALQAEKDGALPAPVRRAVASADPSEQGADFIDGNNNPWDVKDASLGPDGIAQAANKGEDVLVNFSNQPSADAQAMQNSVSSQLQPGAGQVKYVSTKP